MITCPICWLDGAEEKNSADQNAPIITCKRCGTYKMEGLMVKIWRSRRAERERIPLEDEKLLPYLSAYTRQKSEGGETAELNKDNWRGYARQHNNMGTAQKRDRLLALIKDRTTHEGYETNFDCDLEYPLIDAESAEGCYQLLTNLQDRGYVKIRQYLRFDYLVTLMTAGREYLEERSRQTVGEMDVEAVPEAARQDLIKASDRYRSGDLSGALAAACAAVESACARVFEEKGLGDPAKVPSFQQKIIKSLRANGSLKRLETELVNIGWDSSDARQLKENLEVSLNRAAQVMQTLRSKMSDAHGSKTVLEPVVFDSLKWATIIASQLR